MEGRREIEGESEQSVHNYATLSLSARKRC